MKHSIRVFRNKLLVAILRHLHRVSFPQRRLGDDDWVYQWRLDFLTENLEKESVMWCKKLIRPGMIVLDIGAHLGYYTRIFSELVKDSGRVFAFEPCPENLLVLRHNLQQSKYKNVYIFDKAVSSKDGQAVLFISPGHSNHSLNAGYTPDQGRVTVQTISIDSFLAAQSIQVVDFIKIDVEGAEPLVLEGMRQTIERASGLKMLIEYNPIAMQAGGFEPPALLSMLKSMGFQLYRILQGGNLGSLSVDNNEIFNLLCVLSR
ncbi:MAG TPA: FkbM family methyltransferase [Anaerolineales bacterium]|nr:FkbM family methyltransferase [Anaerolineales bacterium]